MIHAVFDVTGCTTPDPHATDLIEAMRGTVDKLGCTILGELPIVFQPHGATCVLVLAESHLTVSTWPEYRLAHIDLFTCRADTDPDHAIRPILTALGASTVRSQRVHRTGPDRAQGPEVPDVAVGGCHRGRLKALSHANVVVDFWAGGSRGCFAFAEPVHGDARLADARGQAGEVAVAGHETECRCAPRDRA